MHKLFIALNMITFIVFGYDKMQSKVKNRRIAEKILILLCFFGGWPGGILSMMSFNHKIRKIKFVAKIPLATVANVFIYVKWNDFIFGLQNRFDNGILEGESFFYDLFSFRFFG